MHIFNKNELISLRISLKLVPKIQINNIPAFVQITAWRRPGNKPLSQPLMVSLLMHVCITQPQWVKCHKEKSLTHKWGKYTMLSSLRFWHLWKSCSSCYKMMLILNLEHPVWLGQKFWPSHIGCSSVHIWSIHNCMNDLNLYHHTHYDHGPTSLTIFHSKLKCHGNEVF